MKKSQDFQSGETGDLRVKMICRRLVCFLSLSASCSSAHAARRHAGHTTCEGSCPASHLFLHGLDPRMSSDSSDPARWVEVHHKLSPILGDPCPQESEGTCVDGKGDTLMLEWEGKTPSRGPKLKALEPPCSSNTPSTQTQQPNLLCIVNSRFSTWYFQNMGFVLPMNKAWSFPERRAQHQHQTHAPRHHRTR